MVYRDDNHKMIVYINYNDPDYTERRSGLKFSQFVVKKIKY